MTTYTPNADFVAHANLTPKKYEQLITSANNDYNKFWQELALANISWHKVFTQGLDDSEFPFVKWFADGELNVSYNCLDRHLAKNANKKAIIFEADGGEVTTVTYQELYELVCQFANGLKELEIKCGDRVVLYMPHCIEAIVAMQAIVRIGAIHSVVFGGFSATALAKRIKDAQAKCVVTTSFSHRGGKLLKMKNIVDQALLELKADNPVKHVIIKQTNMYEKFKHDDPEFKWFQERDIWWHELTAKQNNHCEVENVNSEHPLFILYTSGSTGTPKGIEHSSAGFLLGAITTMKWVFDIKQQQDIFWCTADVGWITGHTYVAYGPLAVGATQVIFEGVPTFPDSSRYWQMIAKHKVSIFYTAPTALRALIKLDANVPKNYNLNSLRLLGSVGEPINPTVWQWYYDVVGNNKCPIVDTWWQTETGCNILTPMPGINALKPGSCVGPIPGINVTIVDEHGNTAKQGESGCLVITHPFPSQLRNVWGDSERYKKTYYNAEIANGKYYITGDLAKQDSDGYFWVLGRTDDVINVSGHRLSTMEVEAAVARDNKVAEAAVIAIPHEIKGEAIIIFVVLKFTDGQNGLNINELNITTALTPTMQIKLQNELKEVIVKQIGAIARPETIYFVDELPKTRSGKIMRRLLRSIAMKEEIKSDISTLENPAIIEQIIKVVEQEDKLCSN